MRFHPLRGAGFPQALVADEEGRREDGETKTSGGGGGGGGAERRKIQIAAQSSRAIRFSVIPAPSSISARFAKANYAADVRTGAALSAPRQRRGTRRREEAEEEDDTGATQSAFLRGAELLD